MEKGRLDVITAAKCIILPTCTLPFSLKHQIWPHFYLIFSFLVLEWIRFPMFDIHVLHTINRIMQTYIQSFFGFLFIVEEVSRNAKKTNMSTEEMKYLSHLLTLDVFIPKQTILYEVAEKLYGRKLKKLEAKACDNFLSGENLLKQKALSYFRYDMECHHNEIAQLASNIGKLAGYFESVIL